MPKTTELLKEALSLPIEQRALLADSLLKSLNTPDGEMDRIWAMEAARRLDEIRSGKVKPIPGDDVFERIRTRFAQ